MNKKDLSLYLDQHADELFAIAQELYDNPEVSENEVNSSALLKKALGDNGFTMHEFPQEELKHAFYAEYGSGYPVVAVLGEYDALPGLSQVGGS
ncbi:MAG TPA: amidohydrolase, partial [Clostridiaceae bacterium]|nr:amidohydrolase [Clostridiaceae bacterium]